MSRLERLTEEITAANDYERLAMLLYLARTAPEVVIDALAYSAAQLAVELDRDQVLAEE
jgi:hypothetical protein